MHVYVKVDLSIMLDCSSTSLAEVGSLNHAQGLPVWPMSIASLSDLTARTCTECGIGQEGSQ